MSYLFSAETTWIRIFEIYDSFFEPNYLSLRYLSKYNKLFAIECHEPCDDISSLNPHKGAARCGIFDFKTCKWSKINYILYYHKESAFYCGISKNEFNSNIYIVTNQGNIIKYDINKNKSIILHSDYNSVYFNKVPIVWMETPNVLHCVAGDIFKTFDIRNNVKSWIKSLTIKEILNDDNAGNDDYRWFL